MFSPPIDSPIVSPITGPWGHGQSGVPGDPIFLALERDGFEDSIGLSVAEFWAQCPVAHRSIYSADGTSWYDAATIITNIEESEFLNNGGELGGSVAKGYFQYLDGTDEAILRWHTDGQVLLTRNCQIALLHSQKNNLTHSQKNNLTLLGIKKL